MAPLRQALMEKLAAKNAIHVTTDEVLVTTGGSRPLCRVSKRSGSGRRCAGLFAVLDADRRPGQGRAGPAFAGAQRDGAAQWDSQHLEQFSTPRVRAIYYNTPQNPSGLVFTREEAEEVASFARERDLIVIADEAYEDLVYDGAHVSIASLPGMAERTITSFTFSKTYAMTGWRAGYAVAKEPFMTASRKIVLYSTNGVATPVQFAMLEALTTPEEQIAARREEYRKRRDLLVAGLNSVGLHCEMPAGAFYAFPDVEKIDKNSRTAAQILLEKAHIATVPGVVFGAQGEGHLRFGYAISTEEIEGCVEALRKFFG